MTIKIRGYRFPPGGYVDNNHFGADEEALDKLLEFGRNDQEERSADIIFVT
jgi:hypothetical protein